MDIMIGATHHQIEEEIDMMMMIGIIVGRGARVEKDEGGIGVRRDMMVTMIGMKDNPNVLLVEEGGREAAATAWVEKTQEESVILEEIIIEVAKVVIIEAVCERMIIMNTMIESSLRKNL